MFYFLFICNFIYSLAPKNWATLPKSVQKKLSLPESFSPDDYAQLVTQPHIYLNLYQYRKIIDELIEFDFSAHIQALLQRRPRHVFEIYLSHNFEERWEEGKVGLLTIKKFFNQHRQYLEYIARHTDFSKPQNFYLFREYLKLSGKISDTFFTEQDSRPNPINSPREFQDIYFQSGGLSKVSSDFSCQHVDITKENARTPARMNKLRPFLYGCLRRSFKKKTSLPHKPLPLINLPQDLPPSADIQQSFWQGRTLVIPDKKLKKLFNIKFPTLDELINGEEQFLLEARTMLLLFQKYPSLSSQTLLGVATQIDDSFLASIPPCFDPRPLNKKSIAIVYTCEPNGYHYADTKKGVSGIKKALKAYSTLQKEEGYIYHSIATFSHCLHDSRMWSALLFLIHNRPVGSMDLKGGTQHPNITETGPRDLGDFFLIGDEHYAKEFLKSYPLFTIEEDSLPFILEILPTSKSVEQGWASLMLYTVAHLGEIQSGNLSYVDLSDVGRDYFCITMSTLYDIDFDVMTSFFDHWAHGHLRNLLETSCQKLLYILDRKGLRKDLDEDNYSRIKALLNLDGDLETLKKRIHFNQLQKLGFANSSFPYPRIY